MKKNIDFPKNIEQPTDSKYYIHSAPIVMIVQNKCSRCEYVVNMVNSTLRSLRVRPRKVMRIYNFDKMGKGKKEFEKYLCFGTAVEAPPIIYINGQCIGGYTYIKSLYNRFQLSQFLKKALQQWVFKRSHALKIYIVQVGFFHFRFFLPQYYFKNNKSGTVGCFYFAHLFDSKFTKCLKNAETLTLQYFSWLRCILIISDFNKSSESSRPVWLFWYTSTTTEGPCRDYPITWSLPHKQNKVTTILSFHHNTMPK